MSSTIIIRELQKRKEEFSASVQFGYDAAPYQISIKNPFSKEEEQKLEWYFEHWLHFPFTDKVRAQEVAISLTTYGERLFHQIFRENSEVITEYARLPQNSEIDIEIIGSPEFHSLHWETMKDPKQPRPLSVESKLVRKNLNPVFYRAELQKAPCLRVLLMTARPGGKRDVSYRTISRPLVEALDQARIPAQIDIVRPGSFEALVTHMEDIRDEHGDGYYHIIHLDMHGALLSYEQYKKLAEGKNASSYLFKGDYAQTEITFYEGKKAFLFFNDPEGRSENGGNPVSDEDLARLLKMRQIPIAVLNACQSAKQIGESETSLGSHLLGAGVQLVLAMGYSVTVSAAKIMMTKLYETLLEGKSIETALRRARLELYHDKNRRAAFGQEIELEDWALPVIYQNRSLDLKSIKAEGADRFRQTEYSPPQMTFRFVGRDIDILELESRLHKRNILLVRGMGGAGKTSLLHHVGWWWQKTRFIQHVFYFGYDIKAYSLQEIVMLIGQQLGLSLSGRQEEDKALVLQDLKSKRHLLILDNLESITGEPLSIPNTLDKPEQDKLKAFLQNLVGSKTLILLGSRAGEKWLQPNPLRESDTYMLRGLDYEAQTELGKEVLEAVGAPKFHEIEEHQEYFRQLLKLLGGFPLAIEVILANLAHAVPAEVIESLQAADVKLDNQDDTVQKTQSIIKCIDYSHSNLSPKAQELLLCLAPFTGVVNKNWIKEYSTVLKAQPELANLPFDMWEEVFEDASKWGLLRSDEQFGEMGYVRLQPIFPYFLKTRLQDDKNKGRKKALELAFSAHYTGIGKAFNYLIESKEAQEKQRGLILTGLEYQNLLTALKLCLEQKDSIYSIYKPLNQYLVFAQRHQDRLNLGEMVLEQLEKYPKELLEGINIGQDLISIIDSIANTCLILKKYPEANKAYKKAISVLEKIKELDPRNKAIGKAGLLHQLGRIAQAQRQWPQAEAYYKEALEIYIEFKDRYEQAGSLHQLGRGAQAQRQWSQAEAYYKEALEIYIEFKDRYEQAGTLHQLGIVAQEQRQWSQAEAYYKEALEIFIEFKDRYEQAGTLHQLGIVAQAQRQWPQAEAYSKEALEIKIEFKDRYSQASTLHQLGIVAQAQRQWPQAEAYYKEALEIFIEFKDRYNQASTLHQLGSVAQAQRQWPQAVDYALRAAAIFAAYKDQNISFPLSLLARAWREKTVKGILEKLAKALGISKKEAEDLLDQIDEKG